jgi:hypothetical protein
MLKNWLVSDRQSRFLQPAERAAVQSAISPQSIGEGLMRFASRASGTNRLGWGTIFPGGGLAWATGGNPVATGALMGSGLAASLGQSGLTRRAVNQADEALRAAAPYAQRMMQRQRQPMIMGATPKQSIAPRDYRNEIARLLALQAERAAVE